MSIGSPRMTVRIPADLLAAVDRQVESRNAVAHGEPWTLSAFVVAALREKLAKMERSRSGRRRVTAEDRERVPGTWPVRPVSESSGVTPGTPVAVPMEQERSPPPRGR